MIEACYPQETYMARALALRSMLEEGSLQGDPEHRKAQLEKMHQRIHIVPVSGYPYDDNKWVNAIQKVVDETVPHAKDIGLIGHSKDSTSYYLNIFPRWKNHVEVADVGGINATDIRNCLFGNCDFAALDNMPDAARDAMNRVIIAGAKIGGYWDTLYNEYLKMRENV